MKLNSTTVFTLISCTLFASGCIPKSSKSKIKSLGDECTGGVVAALVDGKNLCFNDQVSIDQEYVMVTNVNPRAHITYQVRPAMGSSIVAEDDETAGAAEGSLRLDTYEEHPESVDFTTSDSEIDPVFLYSVEASALSLNDDSGSRDFVIKTKEGDRVVGMIAYFEDSK